MFDSFTFTSWGGFQLVCKGYVSNSGRILDVFICPSEVAYTHRGVFEKNNVCINYEVRTQANEPAWTIGMDCSVGR